MQFEILDKHKAEYFAKINIVKKKQKPFFKHDFLNDTRLKDS
jgi:hypothetical protein